MIAFLQAAHSILFNAHILFSLILGGWGIVMAARSRSISGNFWGAVATNTGLAGAVLLVGILMALQGYRPERINIYYLYMVWLVIIMPGMFSQLRGRDDSSAALAFAMLSVFNFFVALSMLQRGLINPWTLPS